MGIISTLLTGGSILGKVCQMIAESGIVKTVNCADGSVCSLKAANTEINGVRFTEVVKDGSPMLHALNLDPDMYACVTYPNGFGKTDGFQVFIPPFKEADLELGDWNSLSPDLPIYVQKLDLSDGADTENDRVIVAFKDLALDGTTLEMPNTHITATVSGFKISFATAGLGDLASAEFKSASGIKATLREPIQCVKGELNETSYSIPFYTLGYEENDTLSGIMQFSITSQSAELIKNHADKTAAENGFGEISAFLCESLGLTSK
ncbi:MAG: hypothetical protein NC299_14430 [Lachnospiraceae bacterium]|nr:hypothetical protein [Ruminococcus sp.]MCM1276532.1 hypothetical protein [Lachnospiraceae bacterium]